MLNLLIILELVFATLLGAIIGLEREVKGKNAGFQTYALVCLGSYLFTIVFYALYENFSGSAQVSFDPARIVQTIAIGVGFLGAGAIFKDTHRVQGLTTAAGLWVVAGIGMTVALHEYFMALIVTFLVILIFVIFGMFEKTIIKK
ncbi:MAG: MgtC/SapB family protein [Candidatus Pacebacteria bacterium]|nr:MgtC/SapB family protein [Candidatus Paceibacterota bacterium]MDD3919033.1 MgtC/SapB family protein [Candidatus Paceibacterota bacterium]